MYGTREDLCRMLNEQYPAETPLNLIIWTPADIEALADGMEYSFSEHDVRAVLERMDTIPEEQRLESGVSAGLVMALIDQVKEGTVAKLAMRQPFVLFKGLTFQKLCLPGAFRPGDHHNKMLRPGRFSALSRGGVYYAFLFQSQPVFQDFSLQPNRLFV